MRKIAKWFQVSIFSLIIGGLLSATSACCDSGECGVLQRDFLLGSWDGKRSALEEKGLSFELVYTGELATNHEGGLKRGSVYLGNVDLTATVDTEKAGLWKGGTFFVYLLNNHGGGPTQDYIGDLQTASNIEAPNATRLYELWYEHRFEGESPLSLLVGQHDMNSEFNVTEYGGLFLNSSFGIGSDISLNTPVSIFPLAAPAVRLKWEPTETSYLMAAAYDGYPGDPSHDKDPSDWHISSNDGAMTILEIGHNHSEEKEEGVLPSTWKAGLWYNTDEFEDVADTDGSGNPVEHSGNYGAYLLIDQKVFSDEKGGEMGVFLQAGGTPDDRNLVDFYLGGGIHYQGLIPGRGEDVFGLAVARASISDKLGRNSAMESHETTVELTYRAQITPWLAVQPDLQFIRNPGADPALDDAIVSIVRFEVVL